MNGRAQPASGTRSRWHDTLLWAVVAALVLDVCMNAFFERTLWHRMAAAEHSIQQLQNAVRNAAGGR